MDPTTPKEEWSLPELTRARRAIVVVDVVESVRLMQEDEAGFIERWRRFVHQVRTEVLPKHGGNLVKSLGDGMLLQFAHVPDALTAAFGMQRCVDRSSTTLAHLGLAIRIGLHAGEVMADEMDIYGTDVNLAARLATLALPGGVVMSARACDAIVVGFDADVEDLGECHLKHVHGTVRAFRARPVGETSHPSSVIANLGRPEVMKPTLAVHAVPSLDGSLDPLAQIVADDLSANFARSDLWHVVSRLSAMAIAGRAIGLETLRERTGATAVVMCSVLAFGEQARVQLELISSRDGTVTWADGFSTSTQSLFNGQCPHIDRAVREMARTLIEREVVRAQALAMPNLEGYALLLRGILQTHTASREAHKRGRDVFEYLIDRHPRNPEPYAWLAKHGVIRLAQGWAGDPQHDSKVALGQVERALELQPDHAFSLAMRGHLAFFVQRDLVAAKTWCDQALQCGPNEPLAWLFLSAVHAHRAEGQQAVACVERACQLSPLDPMHYYYDGFRASAHLAAGDAATAAIFALRSVQANAAHVPSLLTLTVAQAQLGQLDEARHSAQRISKLMPTFSTRRYVERFPGGVSSQATTFGDALREAGAAP